MNAPFSAPKSSLSARVSGSAAAFTATNGPFARGERAWSRRAISSLPVPGLAGDENRDVAGGNPVDEVEQLLRRRVLRDEVVALLFPREEARDEVDERARGRQRLRDVVGRAETNRVDRLRDGAVGRQDDDGRRRRPRPDALHQLETVDLRHLPVGQDEVEGSPVEEGERFCPVACLGHGVARLFEDVPEEGPEARFVVDDQDVRHVRPSDTGSERDATQPPPGLGASVAEPPLATARAFTMARPRPVPSGRDVT